MVWLLMFLMQHPREKLAAMARLPSQHWVRVRADRGIPGEHWPPSLAKLAPDGQPATTTNMHIHAHTHTHAHTDKVRHLE